MTEDFAPRDVSAVARRIAEEQRLRIEYDYLFAPERSRLEERAAGLEVRSEELRQQVEEAGRKIGIMQTNLDRSERDASKRKHKQYNRVVFDLVAEVTHDADAVFRAMVTKYGPSLGGSIRVTHGQVVGNVVTARVVYDVCGGHPADMRRLLSKCLIFAGAALVADPTITVLSRTPLGDDAGEAVTVHV